MGRFLRDVRGPNDGIGSVAGCIPPEYTFVQSTRDRLYRAYAGCFARSSLVTRSCEGVQFLNRTQ
ncbi:MAG: hypothetical protein NVSMB2_15430 [Chloroflexota bacterium]